MFNVKERERKKKPENYASGAKRGCLTGERAEAVAVLNGSRSMGRNEGLPQLRFNKGKKGDYIHLRKIKGELRDPLVNGGEIGGKERYGTRTGGKEEGGGVLLIPLPTKEKKDAGGAKGIKL